MFNLKIKSWHTEEDSKGEGKEISGKEEKNSLELDTVEEGFKMAKCFHPLSIPHPRGTKKSVRLTVPCGNCISCYENRRADWTLRLMQELKISSSAYFLTLTYNDQMIPYDTITVKYKSKKGEEKEKRQAIRGELPGILFKEDIQAYIKRLRAKVDYEYQTMLESGLKGIIKPKLVYYFIGEYGPNTERPHYHGLLFNLYKKLEKCILDEWHEEKKDLGFVNVGKVTQASIHYTTKYMISKMLNRSIERNKENEFSLMSKGIGKSYVETYKKHHRDSMQDYHTYPGGIKQRLPRYYREKIFDEKEREQFNKEKEIEIDEKDLDNYNERKKRGLEEDYVMQQQKRKTDNTIKAIKKRKL